MTLEKVSSELIEPQGILELIYPVGTIYLNSNNPANPATLLGFGTWESFGSERMLLGAGGSYTAEATGGVEEVTLTTSQIPSHAHGSGDLSTSNTGSHSHGGNTSNTGSHNHNTNASRVGDSGNTFGSGSKWLRNSANLSNTGAHSHNIATNSAGAHSHNIAGSTSNAGSGGAHTNMPPYIVVYIWNRVA